MRSLITETLEQYGFKTQKLKSDSGEVEASIPEELKAKESTTILFEEDENAISFDNDDIAGYNRPIAKGLGVAWSKNE